MTTPRRSFWPGSAPRQLARKFAAISCPSNSRTSRVEPQAFFLAQPTLLMGLSTKQASPLVREIQTDHGITSTKRLLSMRREIPLFSDGLRMYSHRLSASSLASKFDGGENAKRRRLHGRRFAVNLRRPLSVERNHVVVTVPIGTLCARTVIVYPRCRQGSAREITAGRRPSADLIPGRVCTRDVR